MFHIKKFILISFLTSFSYGQIVEFKASTQEILAMKLGYTFDDDSTPYIAGQIGITGISTEFGYRKNGIVFPHNDVSNHLFFMGVEQTWFDQFFDIVGTNSFVGYRYNYKSFINEFKLRTDLNKLGFSYGIGFGL